jgi:para-aminobenzoate synthetase component 1
VQARLAWLEAQQPAPAQTFTLTSGWRSNMSAAEYAEKFARVQAYLQSGDCYQVNLAQRFQATYRGDEWQAFTRLNASNKAPFSAFVRLEQGAILSLSPERFIHLAEGPFKPVRLKARCRVLPIPTPIASRRKNSPPRRKTAPKT